MLERAEMLKQLIDHLCWLQSGAVGQREAAERAIEWAIKELLIRKSAAHYNAPPSEEKA